MAVTGSTTDVIKFGSQGDVYDGKLLIRHIMWSGVATAGHDVKVMDYDSETIILEAKAGQHGEVHLDFDQKYGKFTDGIKITTLDSGAVYIYKA